MVSRTIGAIMAAFNISKFMADPTLSQLDKCRKSNLHEIADYYDVSVSSSFVQAEMKVVVLDGLISKGVLSLPAVVESSRVDAEAGASTAVHYSYWILDTRYCICSFCPPYLLASPPALEKHGHGYQEYLSCLPR